MQYETEEQQAEAIRKWWAENGKSIIAGVVLGLAILFGWRGWVDWQERQAETASEQFSEARKAYDGGQPAQVHEKAALLREEYARTPYAALATLLEARLDAGEGKLEQAAEGLTWVRDHAREPVLQEVARLRLARVLVALDRPDDALKELQPLAESGAWTSLVEEIRGDALRAKNDIDGARQAYDRALLTAGGRAPRYLQMKRDDLGDPEG
ncbi:MAG: hypothetical protein D6717_02985 [Gammaproteobacteria bacterium]|nr:MAG: hypothetical protein D6717_02985 [Gammaproteobacteria bacterium]